VSKQKKPQKKSQNSTANLPQTAIQNNFNINIPIDVNAINELAKSDKELAHRVLNIYEVQVQHAIESDHRILSIEEQNIANETNEIPYIRKYLFRGQILAYVTSIGGMLLSAFFGYIGMENAAISSLVIVVGTLAISFLKKNNR
jgi:hypothetical protein